MKNKNLAFIDIETTGFNVELQEIIEIGCVIVEQHQGIPGKIIDEFEIKIRPEHIERADAEALAINGYNESEWIFATNLKSAMEEFSEKTKDCIFVAHNAAFDWSFIAKAFAVTGIENKMFYAKIDTISFALARLYDNPEITKFNLGFLCEYFGIENSRAHTALADARATAALYKKLISV